MTNIKIFKAFSSEALEAQVNKFLKELKGRVTSMQYQVYEGEEPYTASGRTVEYSVLIAFTAKKEARG